MDLQRHCVCTISGPRPHKLPCSNNPKTLEQLLHYLEHETRASINQGYNIFKTGMAMGVDIWAGEIIYHLKSEYPDIRLHCFLPFETQANDWPESWRKRYFTLLSLSDDTVCLQKSYNDGCMHRRNRMMVDKSSRLITVHDGVSKGGTAYTVKYATQKGLDIVIINPNKL